jgi:hypothetical protein
MPRLRLIRYIEHVLMSPTPYALLNIGEDIILSRYSKLVDLTTGPPLIDAHSLYA